MHKWAPEAGGKSADHLVDCPSNEVEGKAVEARIKQARAILPTVAADAPPPSDGRWQSWYSR